MPFTQFHVSCYIDIKIRKVSERPDKKTLAQEIIANGFVKTGQHYGVTDNTIRK